jgi:GH25 family lysozyme M1 (1,4-beta-N-acetylmuramidase)
MRALGVDLSHWDWSFDPDKSIKVLDFAIQKVSEGLYQDPRLEIIWSGVKKVPIRGAYHYLRSAYSWKDQADFFLNIVNKKDYHILALDYERIGNVVNANFTNMAHQWMDYVKSKTNKLIILYTNPSHYAADLFPYGNWMIDYPLWIAQYWTSNVGPDRNPGMPKNRKDWAIYQWASEINYVGHGHEYGCGLDLNKPTSVDLNVFNGTAIEMQKWVNTGTTPPPPPSTVKTGYVNALIGLNVRDQPSTLGKKLYAIPYKMNVVIYTEKSGWYKISTSEEWVLGIYITLK